MLLSGVESLIIDFCRAFCLLRMEWMQYFSIVGIPKAEWPLIAIHIISYNYCPTIIIPRSWFFDPPSPSPWYQDDHDPGFWSWSVIKKLLSRDARVWLDTHASWDSYHSHISSLIWDLRSHHYFIIPARTRVIVLCYAVLWVRDVSSNTWSQKCLKSNEKTLNSRNIVFSHFLVDPGLLVLNKFIKIKNTSDYMWATAWSWKTSGCCQNWIESNTRDLSEKYGIGMLLGHDAAVDESGSTSSTTHSTAVRDELTWDGSSDFF